MKQTTKIVGNVRTIPSVGERAFVFVNGLPYCWTTPVVKIHNQTEDGIQFETLNAMYEIEYDKKQIIGNIA